MKMKILLLGLLVASSLWAKELIVVGVSPAPFDEIMEFVRPAIEKKGYKLKIIEFTDYAIPNVALNDGKLDANLFQHKPYLEEFNRSKGTNLVATTSVAIFPMGVYSKRIKNINELVNGATVSIPNDPTNENRALEILEQAKLIELKKGKGFKTPKDITKNPKNLKFKELKAAQLPRSLDDVDISIINTNYALDYGLNPTKDAIFLEKKDSPYANFVVVRGEDKDSIKTKVIDEALRTKELREFILKKYDGSVIPTF